MVSSTLHFLIIARLSAEAILIVQIALRGQGLGFRVELGLHCCISRLRRFLLKPR